MSTQTLDDIFKGTDPNDAPADTLPSDPPAEETKEETKAAPEETKTDPPGEDDSKGDTPPVKEETPASENDRMVPLKALEAERKKRHAAETNLKQATATPPEPAPDVIEDQKGFEAHFDRRLDTALYNQRLSISETAAKKAHEDFGEMVDTFVDLARDNPALGQAMRDHADPAEFAYQEAQKSIAMKEIGSDPKAFREQMRTEIEAEIRDELKAEAEADAESDALRNIPTSLASAPSVAARGKAKYAGPQSLEEILDRHNRSR